MDIREPKHAHRSDIDLSVDSKADYKKPVLVELGLAAEITQLQTNGPSSDGGTVPNTIS